MSIEEIIKELECFQEGERRSFQGCGNPGEKGALQGEAQALKEAIALLRTHPDAQPNEPLTLEALRGMHGKPGWLDCKYEKGWGIIGVYEFDRMVSINTLNDTYFIYTNGEYNDLLGAKLYRRPPKEEV